MNVLEAGYSDDAKISMLCLDYDEDVIRSEVENQLNDYSYIIYNSSSNTSECNRFRILILLLEPVLATDIRHYKKKLEKMFKGCDPSSFAVGRFFYRPSKFDKEGNKVKISFHEGIKFDFYKMFPHYVTNEAFEKLKNEMLFGKKKYTVLDDREKAKEKFISFLKNKFRTEGFHYPDIPTVVSYAKKAGMELYDAYNYFINRYVGESKCEKNFKECWKKF